MSLDERKRLEIEHSDHRRSIVKGFEYQTDTNQRDAQQKYIEIPEAFKKNFSNTKFYSICKSSFAYRDKLVFSNIKDKCVLDYCCGNGEIALKMAQQGASQTYAIDISEVAIENSKLLAIEKDVIDRCKYEVMDAENMSYEDNFFDLIHEYGALHHLKLDSAFSELSRVLKPEGRLICTEALRHNPLIHMYRKRTPHLRTKWEVEHILGIPEIQSGKKYFNKIEVRFFHLSALAAVPFRKFFFFNSLLRSLDQIDSFLLRLPVISKMAWVAVIVYSEPIK